MPHPCPSCQRPNGPHRETCLYCGHKLAVKLDLAEEQGVDEAAIEEAVFAALSGAAAPNPRKSPSVPEAPKAPTPPVQSQKPDPTDLVVSPALEPPPPKREDYAAQLLSEVSVSLAIESSGLPLGRRPFVLVLDGCGDPDTSSDSSLLMSPCILSI